MSTKIQSERICFHDLRRTSLGAWRKQFDEFMASVPAEKRPLVRWVNRLNADVTSEDYNPLGSWGRFEVIEEDPTVEFLAQLKRHTQEHAT
jgi:hypothetical protein